MHIVNNGHKNQRIGIFDYSHKISPLQRKKAHSSFEMVQNKIHNIVYFFNMISILSMKMPI